MPVLLNRRTDSNPRRWFLKSHIPFMLNLIPKRLSSLTQPRYALVRFCKFHITASLTGSISAFISKYFRTDMSLPFPLCSCKSTPLQLRTPLPTIIAPLPLPYLAPTPEAHFGQKKRIQHPPLLSLPFPLQINSFTSSSPFQLHIYCFTSAI